MERNICIVMLMAAVALLALSCKKSAKPSDGDKKDTSEQSGPTVKITLDGDFAEWDAITAETAKNDAYVDMAVAELDEDPVRVLKIATDENSIFFYAEISIVDLPQSSICGEWGSSYSGAPTDEGNEKGDGDQNNPVFENFNIFIDPDADGATGFLTYPTEKDGDEPAIPELGCEMCAQNLFFYNPETKKLCVAWNQINIGPTVEKDANGNESKYDYTGDLFQVPWDSEFIVPRYGWQNADNSGKGDNVAPAPANIKSQVSGNIVKVEFSIELGEIVNYEDSFDGYALGVCYCEAPKIIQQSIGPLSASYVK